MKRKFKVMGDSKNTFLNIELDLVIEDDSIGNECNVLGGKFIITQNGKILVLADKDWVLTLMDITPVENKEKPKLIINETLEIYLETKEISVKSKCTYKELYEALKEEWKIIRQLKPEIGEIPFMYDDKLTLFTFKDGWGFENGNFSMLGNGSFSRLNEDGRNI